MPWWRRLPDLAGLAARMRMKAVRFLPVAIAVAVGLALIAGASFGYRFITTSDRFAIEAIEVRGNRALSREQVAARLGTARGDNIFRVKLAAVADELERDPWVARASVRRGLPSTLIAEVKEHRPAALVELAGLYLADAGGRIFKRAAIERGEGAGLPIITGLLRDDYRERPEVVERAIQRALRAAALYAEEDRPALGEVNIHPRHGITVITRDDAVAIHMGRGDDSTLRRRLSAFDTVWRTLGAAERARARTVYAYDSGRLDRLTIAFNE